MPKPIIVLQSKSHIITVTSKGVRYKLFQIHFGPKGDIYVNFPYYKSTSGLVGQAILPPNKTSILLSPNCSKVTSHLVKFAHHPDGEVHFSQDGKVKTEIRKKSLPLDKLDGHLFTVFMHGIQNFKQAGSAKYDNQFSPERCVINFDLNTLDFEGLKFAAMWNPFNNLAKSMNIPEGKEFGGPKFSYKDREGVTSHGFMISPEPGNPFNAHILSLRISAWGKLDKNQDTSLVFMGGFDQNIETSDPSKDYSFLIFMYPHTIKTGDGMAVFESIDFNGKDLS